MSIKNSKKDFLKLLAKTSVVAMTAMSAGSAFAGAARVTQTAPGADPAAPNQNATDNRANFSGGGAVFHADDWIQLGAADHHIMINTADTFKGIDLNGKVATGSLTITDAADTQGIGSIGNGGANAALGLVLSDAVGAYTFTLNGTKTDAASAVAADTYVGLGDITIGENATLEINAAGPIELSGDIDGSAGDKGILKISSDTTLTGNVGNANTINAIDVDDNLTFKGAADQIVKTSGGISVADGKTLTADSTNGTIDIYGVVHGNDDAALLTTLAIKGGNDVTFHDKVGTNAADATKGFASITTGDGEVVFNDTVDATTITTNKGKVLFKGNVTGDVDLFDNDSEIIVGDNVTITGGVDNTTGADGKGTINFAGAGAVTGDLGATKSFASVNLQGAGEVILGGDVDTLAVTLAANSILQMKGDLIIGAGNIKGPGVIKVNANDKTIVGVIGDGGGANALSSILFAGDHKLNISNGVHHIDIIKSSTDGDGTLNLLNDLTINGNIGLHVADGDAGNRYLKAITLAGKTATISGNVYTNDGIQLTDNASKLILNGNDSVVNNVQFQADDATLEVGAAGHSITISKADSDGASKGKIKVLQGANATFGNIGATNGIRTLELAAGADAANLTRARLTDAAKFDSTIGDGGIHFNAHTKLTIDEGVQLTFTEAGGNECNISAAADGNGILILNGQNINKTIGVRDGHRLGTVRAASGNVSLAQTEVDNLEIANGATVTMDDNVLTAQTAINPYMAGDASTAKLILSGAGNRAHTVAAGGVGAIGEINFTGAGNHSLTVTNGAAAATFDVLSVTSDAGGTRTITIESEDNMEIPTNFSTLNGDQLTKLHINSTHDGNHTFGLKGNILNVADITFEKPNHASAHALRSGLNADNSKYKPQIIIGDINGDNGGAGELNFEVAGHTFLQGDVAGDIDAVKFVSDDKRLYSSGNVTGLNFENDGQLYLFAGDHAINNDIVVGNDRTAGCIVARGISADVAKGKFAAGDENFKIDAEIYGDTLTINKAVGDIANNARLQMIDAGEGTVVFSDGGGGGGGDVNVNKVNAKIVEFDRVATFNIGTLMDSNSGGNVEEIIISKDPTIAANSTVLGTENDPLKIRLVTPGAVQLTLEDNVNVNVEQAGVKKIEGGGVHAFVFKGNSKVWSGIGTEASPFSNINVVPQAANQTVNFYNEINTVNGITLTNNVGGGHEARINLHNNVKGSVLAAVDGDGIVTLSGSGKTIDKIGALGGFAIGLLNVNGNENKVDGEFNVDTVNFQKDVALTIRNDAEISTAITASGNNTGTLIIEGGDFTPAAQIGSDDSRVKTIQLGENSDNITIANIDGHNTLVLPRADALGEFIFAGNTKSPNLDIGMEGKKFALVDLGGDVTFRDAHADELDLQGNTATFRSAKAGMHLNGGTANVINDGYIKATGAGTINITGNAEIAAVGLLGDDVTTLNVTTPGVVAKLTASEIHATNVNHTDSTINASSPVKLNGTYTATNATLGSKGRFEVTGKATLSKSFTLNDTSTEGVALDLSNSANVNIAGLSTLTINLDAQNGASLADGRSILAFNEAHQDKAGNAFKTLLDKTTITSNHPLFSEVTLVPNGKYATLKTEFTAQQAVSDLKGLADGEKQAIVHAFTANKENLEFLNDLALNPESQGGFDGAARRWGSSETPKVVATSTVDSVMNEISEIGTGRVTSALASTTSRAVPSAAAAADAGKMVGVAAGDSAEKFGLWASAIGNVATQEKRKSSTAFKSNMFGGLIGADTMLSDKAMAGFALGNAQGNVKFKDFKLGDKIKASSWVFSGYGSYSINDNWFVRGAITGSSTKVNSSEKRTGRNIGTAYAHGKYSVEAFSAEAAVGYTYRTEGGSTITPSLGVRIGRVNDIEYKESGAGVQNREVKHNASHNTSILLGTQYATTQYWDDMVVTPEAHVNIRYGYGMKTPKGKFKALGTNTFSSYSGDKPTNLNVNMGAGVTSHVDNVEYGVGYDIHLADKYIGHQGTLKVKVKF